MNREYEFRALPLRHNTAPHVFTLIRAHTSNLTSPGHTVPSLPRQLAAQVSHSRGSPSRCKVCNLQGNCLNWIINLAKSDLSPSQSMKYLALEINTRRYIVQHSQDQENMPRGALKTAPYGGNSYSQYVDLHSRPLRHSWRGSTERSPENPQSRYFRPLGRTRVAIPHQLQRSC